MRSKQQENTDFSGVTMQTYKNKNGALHHAERHFPILITYQW